MGVTPKWPRCNRITIVLSSQSLDWIVGGLIPAQAIELKNLAIILVIDLGNTFELVHHIGDIEIIMSFYQKKRKGRWDYTNDDCVMKGTLGELPHEIGAYYKFYENTSVALSEIYCPIAEIPNQVDFANPYD